MAVLGFTRSECWELPPEQRNECLRNLPQLEARERMLIGDTGGQYTIRIPGRGFDQGIKIPAIDIPGTGGAAQVCPPGTACNGPSVNLPGGFSGCLGKCQTIGVPGGGGDGNVGGSPLQDPTAGAGCDLPTQAYCQSMCGSNGAQCRSMGACQLPNGRGGSLNKSRYYTFGDCRRGTSPGVVEPGTKCVKRRRMNPANAKASARAARRVTAAIKHQDRLVKAMKKTMRGR